jgi:hypothetical protein
VPITQPVYASDVLTAAGVFTNAQTVVVGGKTYTTQTALTNVDGNVLIGASAAATLQNLFDAINLTGTPGTQYAAAMTANDHVIATAVTATTLTVKSRVPGKIGNLIAATETQTNASWASALLTGGTGSMADVIDEILESEQLRAGLAQILHNIDGFPAAD